MLFQVKEERTDNVLTVYSVNETEQGTYFLFFDSEKGWHWEYAWFYYPINAFKY